jgi:hypothetical protein
MSIDFQQVREQVKVFGDGAGSREQALQQNREQVKQLLVDNAKEIEALRQKIQLVVRNYDASLRCALPVDEPLNAHLPVPELQKGATVLAADGSQINYDRHAEVEYCLVNVGAICMSYGDDNPPKTTVRCELFYDEQLFSMTEGRLALLRDLRERSMLVELARDLKTPVVTFTDGPMELWGARTSGGEEASDYQRKLNEYLEVLAELHERSVVTAGYVDKPGAGLVVRLLEVVGTAVHDLPEIKDKRPFRGVRDTHIFREILAPGERSAVFALQSVAIRSYKGPLALHFFYLNVGRPGRDWIVRVDIPGWVVENPSMLDQLHSVLVDQCRVMGSRPYPYLLHRAHETALVTLDEQEQVSRMLAMELQKRGIYIDGKSQKQASKELHGRMRHKT